MIKVLIADDHSIVRLGIKYIIEHEIRDCSITEALTFFKAKELIETSSWDLIILDQKLPGGDLFEMVKYAKTRHFDTPILVLSTQPDDELAIRLIQSGAQGYIDVNSVTEELIFAIKKALSHQPYISSSIVEKITNQFGRKLVPPLDRLSAREYQILLQIAQGKSLKQIASELFISDRSVSTYKSRLMKKLKLKNNSDLIRYAISNKLID